MFPVDMRSTRNLFGALAIAALVVAGHPAEAAGISREPIDWHADGGVDFGGESSDALVMKRPVVRQGTTRLTAAKATATGVDQDAGNSSWEFTGDVHLEFDGAELNADSANVVFANGRLTSVVVQRVGGKPVHVEFENALLDVESAKVTFVDNRINNIVALGKPAQFSHQLGKSDARANGRANQIDYDARKSSVLLTGDLRFTKGPHTVETQLLKYNLDDGSFSTQNMPGSGVLDRADPADRVPAPRTPDRATAK